LKVNLLLVALSMSLSVNAQNIDSSVIEPARSAKSFLVFGKRSSRLVLSLQKILVQDEIFWFGFSIRNLSNLSYPVELLRLYIRDTKQGRRTSGQELELVPLFLDTVQSVRAKKTIRFLLAVPKFTIPDSKSLLLEIFETNGGRNLSLSISNRLLFMARPLKNSSL
jgi:hypothetical protein